jgi:hypothetical protein
MDKIPIKGYASFHPLKHCLIGSGFQSQWFKNLAIGKNNKIMDPLKRIAEETEEDYQTLEKILRSFGVKTYRSFLDISKYQSLHEIKRPPVCPRDYFAVIGEKFFAVDVDITGYENVLTQIDTKNLIIHSTQVIPSTAYPAITTAKIARAGKDLFWDLNTDTPKYIITKYKELWTQEGFRVHTSYRGYHSDGAFCLVKPGCIVSLKEIQNYEKNFPFWEVLYLPDQSWSKMSPFLQIKSKVGGRWWLKGEEHNDQLIEFVNIWLDKWVGYVEETVFDVNMLSINENTIICNNYNKEVFDFFKKHGVEPVVFNFRHRYFWDGGIHCITQDLYREGVMEDYFG